MAKEGKTSKQDKLPSSLRIWADENDTDDTRTVIFRIAPNVDEEVVCKELAKLQVNVTSAGAGVIVGNIARSKLARATELPQILRIEEPTRLAPRGRDANADLLSFDGGKRLRLPDN